MIKIDFQKLEQRTGLKFNNPQDLLYYFSAMLYFLNTHNKNYTKEQERKISDLNDLFDCMEAVNG